MIASARRTLGAIARVPLDHTGARWALVREPIGLDEERIAGRTTLEALRLLDDLLIHEPGAAVGPGDAASLTIPERDLLLAATWCLGWGPKISGTLTCTSCGHPFDFDFSLADLADEVRAATGVLPLENGVYTAGSVRFRLPTGEDERAVVGLPEAEAERALLSRCLVEGDPATAGDVASGAMETVGSGVDIAFDARCAECDHVHSVRFQIQDYLLGALASNWAALVEDVHRLALAYRWSLDEILALPRSRRRAFITLLDGDSIPRGRMPA